MKIKVALCLTLLACAQMGFAKTSVFTWDNELCTFKGQYDDQKINATQLKNTAELLRLNVPFFDDKTLSQKQHDAELASVVARLQNSNAFIQNPAFDLLRTQYQEQAKFWHELAATKHRVTESQDYATLAQFRPQHTQACLPIVRALSNRDTQTEQARIIFTQECKDNANPAQCLASQMQNTPFNLLNHSWHNCANNTQPTISDAQLEKAHKVFRAQFNRIKQSCDEP